MKPDKSLIWLCLVLIAFFGLQYFFFKSHTQAIHLSDELEHLSGSWEMLNFNKTLYQDLSVNHQPLPFIAGFILLKFTHPPNLFMLIERSRQFLFSLSFLGAIILTLRFKWSGLLAVLLIELVKYYFFGYYLVAESLVVYPLMYCGGLFYEILVHHGKIYHIDDLIFGLCLFIGVFSLSPIIPFAILSLLIYVFYRPRALFFRVLPTIFLLIIALSTVVPWPSWYEETIHNMMVYFIPAEIQTHSVLANLRLLFFPFLSLFNLRDMVAKYYVIMTSGLFAIFLISLHSKNLVTVFKLIFFYILIVLLNLRVNSFFDLGFGVFHLLPQVAFFTMVSVMIGGCNLVKQKDKSALVYFPQVLLLFALISSACWWFQKHNKIVDHYVQYETEETIGDALKTLKHPTDTLLSGPQRGEANLVSGIPFPGRQITYFNWTYAVPRLHQEFLDLLQNHPPTFIYFPEKNSLYYPDLEPYLIAAYVPIVRLDGRSPGLYMSKTAISNRTPEEWKKFQLALYQKPI